MGSQERPSLEHNDPTLLEATEIPEEQTLHDMDAELVAVRRAIREKREEARTSGNVTHDLSPSGRILEERITDPILAEQVAELERRKAEIAPTVVPTAPRIRREEPVMPMEPYVDEYPSIVEGSPEQARLGEQMAEWRRQQERQSAPHAQESRGWLGRLKKFLVGQ